MSSLLTPNAGSCQRYSVLLAGAAEERGTVTADLVQGGIDVDGLDPTIPAPMTNVAEYGFEWRLEARAESARCFEYSKAANRNATSQLYYGICGRGFSAVNGRVANWEKGDFQTLAPTPADDWRMPGETAASRVNFGQPVLFRENAGLNSRGCGR
jgi:hypothetical protein